MPLIDLVCRNARCPEGKPCVRLDKPAPSVGASRKRRAALAGKGLDERSPRADGRRLVGDGRRLGLLKVDWPSAVISEEGSDQEGQGYRRSLEGR